jgi:hypothetical protein
MRNSTLLPVRRSAGIVWAAAMTLLAVCMSSCTSPPPVADARSEVMVVPVKYGDVSGDVIRPQERPVKAFVTFGAIAGTLLGSAPGPKLAVPIDSSQAFSINMSELQTYMSQRAATLTATPGLTSTLQIDPIDTRFARVGHFLRYESAARAPGPTRLVDSGSKDNLVLAYFDRPCHLTGTLTYGGAEPGSREYDVVIEHAGLNWLAATKKGPGDYSVVRHAPSPVRPVFVIEYK